MEKLIYQHEQEQKVLGEYLLSSFDFNDEKTLDQFFALLKFFNIPFEKFRQNEGMDLLLGHGISCELFLKKSIEYQKEHERRSRVFWSSLTPDFMSYISNNDKKMAGFR